MKPPPIPRFSRPRRPVVGAAKSFQGEKKESQDSLNKSESPDSKHSKVLRQTAKSKMSEPLETASDAPSFKPPVKTLQVKSGSPDNVDHALMEALSKQGARIKRVRMRRFGTVLGIAGGLGLAVYLFYYSPLFALDLANDCTVSGADTVPANTYCQALKDFDSRPLPALASSVLEQKVLSEVKEAREVQVSKVYLHGIHIEVTERVPIAASQYHGKLVGIDADGVMLERSAPELASLVLLDVDLTKDKGTKSQAVRSCLEVVNTMPADFRELMASVSTDSEGLVVVNMKKGAKVVWGSPSNGKVKAQVASLLLQEKHPNNISVVDPANPAIW